MNGTRFRADVDLVVVPVTVTDTRNQPVTYLRKEDFEVYEDGVPQMIANFSREDTPLSIGILLDTSGSMTGKFDTAREALDAFFSNANKNDEFFIINYSTRPRLLANRGLSVETMQQKVALIEPDGSTPLLDAIYLGLSMIRDARYERRALLIISDGGDNASRYRAREIREVVQERDVQIFAMAVFSSFSFSYEDWAGKKLLSDIAEASGGRAAIVSHWTSLPSIAAEISHSLRNQYLIAYKPTNANHDGSIRKIKVKISSLNENVPLHLSYKRSYVARKE